MDKESGICVPISLSSNDVNIYVNDPLEELLSTHVLVYEGYNHLCISKCDCSVSLYSGVSALLSVCILNDKFWKRNKL